MAGRKVPRMSNLRTLLGVMTALVATVTVPAATPKESSERDVPRGLTFRISGPTSKVMTAKTITVTWELENAGPAPVYICQWPGTAYGTSYEVPNGSEGTGPGYPSTQQLARKYFIELKPGEALFGADQVEIYATPSGQLSIRGEYRSDQTGKEYGLSGWSGIVYSNTLDIKVPRGPGLRFSAPEH
jgi:hypothetical protein